jgi:hypothetical protein
VVKEGLVPGEALFALHLLVIEILVGGPELSVPLSGNLSDAAVIHELTPFVYCAYRATIGCTVLVSGIDVKAHPTSHP